MTIRNNNNEKNINKLFHFVLHLDIILLCLMKYVTIKVQTRLEKRWGYRKQNPSGKNILGIVIDKKYTQKNNKTFAS